MYLHRKNCIGTSICIPLFFVPILITNKLLTQNTQTDSGKRNEEIAYIRKLFLILNIIQIA